MSLIEDYYNYMVDAFHIRQELDKKIKDFMSIYAKGYLFDYELIDKGKYLSLTVYAPFVVDSVPVFFG